MVVVEKLEIELDVLDREAVDMLDNADSTLGELKDTHRDFSKESANAFNLYTGAMIGAFSGLVFWLSKTSPLIEYNMSSIRIAIEQIGFVLGEVFEPAFRAAENTVWEFSDTIAGIKEEGALDYMRTEVEKLNEEYETSSANEFYNQQTTSLPEIYNWLKKIAGIDDPWPVPSEEDLAKLDRAFNSYEKISQMTPQEKLAETFTGGGMSIAPEKQAQTSSNTQQSSYERQVQVEPMEKSKEEYSRMYKSGFISTGIYNKLSEANLV